MTEKKVYTFEDLRNIISKLRSPEGCSWDRVQTHASLCPCMIEEAYEAVDGIRILTESGQTGALKEELGDVLLQVLFHCQIAEENQEFTLEEVIDQVSAKMVHRHPHVFPDEHGELIPKEQVDWEALKKEEKPVCTPEEEIDAIPHSLPALIRTAKVLKKMERYYGTGKDFEESAACAESLLCAFVDRKDERDDQEELLGELLLSIVNLGRKKGLNSEQALIRALERCIRYFS
ncbi:MAG: MazG family protein [Fusicatenibacter sp.]|nr:MazG family protein [Lachnospiraceae bacterium]MDY2938586.1 MazG family protein [Fusicatenibacter sp.]